MIKSIATINNNSNNNNGTMCQTLHNSWDLLTLLTVTILLALVSYAYLFITWKQTLRRSLGCKMFIKDQHLWNWGSRTGKRKNSGCNVAPTKPCQPDGEGRGEHCPGCPTLAEMSRLHILHGLGFPWASQTKLWPPHLRLSAGQGKTGGLIVCWLQSLGLGGGRDSKYFSVVGMGAAQYMR